MGHFAHSGSLGGITLPLEIFRDPRLTGNDRQFLVALLEYRDGETGRINVGGMSIQSVSGMPKGNLSVTIKRLVTFGWLKYTQGSSVTPNDYTMMIPLETDFKYRVKADRLTDAEWAAEEKRRKDSIDGYTRKKVRKKNQWLFLGEDELIDELEHEAKSGTRYIPDDVLKNYEIVRGEDNSREARLRRLEEGSGGFQDLFDREVLADSNDAKLLQDLIDM
jgi:hypothetical protein